MGRQPKKRIDLNEFRPIFENTDDSELIPSQHIFRHKRTVPNRTIKEPIQSDAEGIAPPTEQPAGGGQKAGPPHGGEHSPWTPNANAEGLPHPSPQREASSSV
eukprot:scaffold56577_cov37-Tisochrysis_lutea.AAC.6